MFQALEQAPAIPAVRAAVAKSSKREPVIDPNRSNDHRRVCKKLDSDFDYKFHGGRKPIPPRLGIQLGRQEWVKLLECKPTANK